MDLPPTDKLNLSAPEVRKSRRLSKDKNEFESIRKVEDILNCSADTALMLSNKTNSKSSKKKLSFLERQKLRFKLLEGTTQKITFAQGVETKETLRNELNINVVNIPSDVKNASFILKQQSETEKEDNNEENGTTDHRTRPKKIKNEISESKFKVPIPSLVKKKSETKVNKNQLPSSKKTLDSEFKKCSVDFQTGSGKKIEISERALKRASKIFDDITDLSPSDAVHESYQLNVSVKTKLNDELSSETRDEDNKVELDRNVLKDKLSQWESRDLNKDNTPDFKRNFENKHKKSSDKRVRQTRYNDNKKELLWKASQTASDTETRNLSKSRSSSALPSTTNRRSSKNNKRNLNSVVASPNNKSFTQVSDTQMCWVADNAECLIEATDSQWHSECDMSKTHIKTEVSEDGFEDLSTQEAEFLGNMSFSVHSNHSFKSTKADIEVVPTQILNEFCGFSNFEIDEALKLNKLYCQSTKYIKTDINKKKFFPVSFIFEDVKLNLQETKRISSYSLRSSHSKSPASPNLKIVSRKSKRTSNTKTSKRKGETSLNKTLINSKKRSSMDTVTPNTEDNLINESFIDKLEELSSPLSPAGIRSKKVKSRSNSSLSSVNTNKAGNLSENSSLESSSSRKNKNTQKHYSKSNTSESLSARSQDSVSFEEKKLFSIKSSYSNDEIFEAQTQTYKPQEPANLEPELFEGYDLFEEETFASASNPANEDAISTNVSAKKNEEHKRKVACGDELHPTDKKRIKMSSEEVNFSKVEVAYKDTPKKTNDSLADCKDEINTTYAKNEENLGFCTAGGKKIEISEIAIQKVKKLFADCEGVTDTSHSKIKDKGFFTATGEKVKVSEEAMQETKKIFVDCENAIDTNYVKSKEIFEFSTAGGKKIEVSEIAVQKAKNLFADCDNVTDPNHLENKEIVEFSTVDEKKIEISKEDIHKTKNVFADFEKKTDTKSFGFSTAAGKRIDVSENALQKAKLMFADCEKFEPKDNSTLSTAGGKQIDVSEGDCEMHIEKENTGFCTARGTDIPISEQALQKAKNFFADCEDSIPESNLENKENFGFSTAGGKKIQISEAAIQKTKNVFANLEEHVQENLEKDGFTTAGGNKIEISEESLVRAKEFFSGCNLTQENSEVAIHNVNVSSSNTRETKKLCTKLEDRFTDYKKLTTSDNTLNTKSETTDEKSTQITNESTPVVQSRILKNISSKKRLGMSSCRQINISENSMKKAKLIFEDIDSPQSIKSLNLNNSFGQYSSTPLRCKEQSTPKNLSFNSPQNGTLQNTTLTADDSTLLSHTPKEIQRSGNFTDTSLIEELPDSFSRFNFRASQNASNEDRKSNMKKEYELTKMKISVIETRMRMFEKQQEILKNKPPEYKGLIPGHLYKLKTKSKRRFTLRQAVEDERPGKLTFQEALTSGVPPSVLEVTSENATKLNFFVPWWPNAQQTYPAVIQTEDKTTVIPNESNNVGLAEMEPAFLTTPGIDATLLPRGWVKNHFRWIVWKLSSMERSFPDKFSNFLTVENVISQLKYRYDREIDRAQRPAIRKILERDDVAARRLVLCVAAVVKIHNQKYELELTDGWYSIKASIDSALGLLVERGIIKAGLKLILHGAELSNCEACHPLDTPEDVRLQIHYNSTRRAAWYCKLGYQRDPRPFCINLRTIKCNGGAVSCACAYVARVYPVSYMERLDSTVIWRNIKAEQRSASAWERKQTDIMEHLQHRVQDELEKERIEEVNNQKKSNSKLKDIQNITCPKTLYQILEISNDPESIQEAMTPSQCLAVQDYAKKITTLRQDEMSSRLREIMSKEKIKNRDVCSVLKLLLVDVESPYHSRFLSFWRPKESHFQELKEGNVVRIFNVAVKNNGSLSSIPRTQFEVDLDADTIKFEYMERKVTPISETLAPNFKPIFNEFDTVGIAVYVDIEQFSQTIWLADENSSFLMIKVTEGPETCSFEGITPGNILSATNLIFQKCTKLYTEAMANHYTIFSSYPNQSYLQHFLKAFIEHMPRDIDKYLDECKDNVEVFLAQNAMRSSLLNISFNSTSQVEELKSRICGLNPMTSDADTLTLSDEELSTIDTQVYING